MLEAKTKMKLRNVIGMSAPKLELYTTKEELLTRDDCRPPKTMKKQDIAIYRWWHDCHVSQDATALQFHLRR